MASTQPVSLKLPARFSIRVDNRRMGIFQRWLNSSTQVQRSPQVTTRQNVTEARQAREREWAGIEAGIRAEKVFRDEYLSREEERQALILDIDGLPTGYLALDRNRLLVMTSVGKVNPKSAYAHKVGIFSFTIRGALNHYSRALRSGNFSPGTQVRLVREPRNEFDSAAIAIYASDASSKTGYVNKLNARRLAPLMDRGADLVAISTRGEPSGIDLYVPQILVAERRVMEHLLRRTTIVLSR